MFMISKVCKMAVIFSHKLKTKDQMFYFTKSFGKRSTARLNSALLQNFRKRNISESSAIAHSELKHLKNCLLHLPLFFVD